MGTVESARKMRIDAPTLSWDGEYALVSSTFHVDDRAISLWFKTKGSPINFGAAQDAFLACTLIPAMRIGGTLVVEGAVSPQLLKSITTIQQIISKWYSAFHIIDVVADKAANREIEKIPARSAQFFSGGVDSFYTMLKNRDEIQDLYFVRGFDLFLNMKSSLNLASRQAHAARRR